MTIVSALSLRGELLADKELAKRLPKETTSLELDDCQSLTLEALHTVADLPHLKRLTFRGSSIERQLTDGAEVLARTIQPRHFAPVAKLTKALDECPPELTKLQQLFALTIRVQGATNGPFEQGRLSLSESFQIAYYSLTKLLPLAEGSNLVTRVSKAVSGLCRPLLYDRVKKIVYIHALNSLSHINGDGVMKWVRSAAAFSLDTATKAPQFLARSYSKSHLASSDQARCKREAGVATALQGIQGVVQVFASTVYVGHKTEVSRVAMVMEAFEGDLFDAITKNKLTDTQTMEAAKGMIYGLDGMHAADYYHGDVKIENYLYRLVEDPTTKEKHCVCKLSDFGFSYKITNPTELIEHPILGYGTKAYRSPEVRRLHPDETTSLPQDQRASDAFALGIALMMLIEKHGINWDKAPYDEIAGKIEALLKPVMPSEERILAMREKIKKNEKLTIDEQRDSMRWLYKQLLQVDPEKRFTIDQARWCVDRIVPDFVVE